MSSACQCHIDGAYCFYCEVYSPVAAENERLSTALEESQRDAQDWEDEYLRLKRVHEESDKEALETHKLLDDTCRDNKRLKAALRGVIGAIDRGDLRQTRMSSGTDYVIYFAREAVKDGGN